MTPEELLAWVAGFYEGEGSVCAKLQNGHPKIVWRIDQRDGVLLDRVEEWLKSIEVKSYHSGNSNGNNIRMRCLYVCNYPDVERIYSQLARFLSPRRIEQFEDAFETIFENSRKYGSKI